MKTGQNFGRDLSAKDLSVTERFIELLNLLDMYYQHGNSIAQEIITNKIKRASK